jgi:hypothetical protein
MASNEPAMEEVSKPYVENPRPKRYTMIVFFLAFLVLIWVTITTVTGQWVKVDGKANNNNVYQVDLWSTCTCFDADTLIKCSEQNRLFRAASGFSVIALGCQFLAIFLFSTIYTTWFGRRHTYRRIAAIVFSWLAVVALLITWAVFAGLFSRAYCHVELKDIGDLNWSFALRIVEFVFWIVVSIMFTISNRRPEQERRQYLRIPLILAVFIMTVTVATTAGRGWIVLNERRGGVTRNEFSVWEACTCVRSKYFPCMEERELFRNQQAWSIMSIGFQFIFVVFVLAEVPRGFHVFMSFLVLACTIITWANFSQWFSKGHCGQPSPDTVFELFWPFGLNVVASIVQCFIFFITIGAVLVDYRKENVA